MKQTLKRLSAFALALALSLGLVQTGQRAAAADKTRPVETVLYINPLYRDEIDEEDLRRPTLFSGSTSDSGPRCESLPEAVSAIRNQLKQRSQTVQIRLPDSLYESGRMQSLFDQAVEHTGVPTEGDYLRWQYGGWEGSTSGAYQNGSITYTLTYNVTYYTNAAQESEVDSAVDSLLSKLNLAGKNNYEKTKAIYDWLCNNITYDNANLNNNDYKLKHTAYAALINRTSVCQGYAVLLYRLLLEEGIPCRLISGIGNGGGHAWNIIKVGRSWYDVDATWDAPRAVAGVDYDYFLRCDANFDDHARDDEYKTAAFRATCPMDSADFNLIAYNQLLNEHNKGHSWGDWTVEQAPTCEETGVQSHTCDICNVTQREDIPAAGHQWGSWNTTVPAACESEGSKTRACSVCGKKETQTLPATGHRYQDTVTAPTCTKQGYTTHSCPDCGNQYVDSYTEPKGHRWNDGVVTTQPTDEEEGIRTFTCSVCGTTRTEPVPAKGHHYQNVVTPPTCTKQGYTTHTCSDCGKSYVDSYTDALGHTWDNGTVTTTPGCLTEGVRTFTCSACQTTRTEPVPAAGHHYQDKVTAPTCTEGGYTTHTCPACGSTYTDSYTEPEGHKPDEGRVTTQPTCTEEGEKTFTCTICGDTVTQPVPASGHHYQDKVTAPTCTERGYTTHTCPACGDSYSDSYTAPSGHRLDEGRVTTQPTCTEEGEKTFTCTVCGTAVTEPVPAAGHHYEAAVTAPTCEEGGYTTYTCTVCGDRYEGDETEPLDHQWDEEGEVLTEPTYIAEGSILYRCLRCGEEVILPLPKLPQLKNKVTVTKSFTKTASTKARSFKLNAKATGGKLAYMSSSKSVTVKKGTVTIAKNFVGKATITVTAGSDAYETVSAKVTVTVNLPKVSLSEVKNIKGKKLTAKWTKAAGAAGYELQCATNKGFTQNKKTAKIKSGKTLSATVKGLKKGKTYYVRVRACKGSATTPWSKLKTVKIKK